MQRNGKERHLQPVFPQPAILSAEEGINALCVQRSEGLINVGIGPIGHEWVRLNPDEARKVAGWLLRVADRAEAYTPDE